MEFLITAYRHGFLAKLAVMALLKHRSGSQIPGQGIEVTGIVVVLCRVRTVRAVKTRKLFLPERLLLTLIMFTHTCRSSKIASCGTKLIV